MVTVYDIECYPNYFLAVFMDAATGAAKEFSYLGDGHHDTAALREYIAGLDTLAGYNSRSYDNPVLTEFIETGSVVAARAKSDGIIGSGDGFRNPFTKPLSSMLSCYKGADVDLMSINNLRTGLKVFEAASGMSIEEMPVAVDAVIAPGQVQDIVRYCRQDCAATAALYAHPETQAALRVRASLFDEFPDLDRAALVSYSATTLISSILPAEAKRRHGIDQKTSFRAKEEDQRIYYGKDFIDAASFGFRSPVLRRVLAAAIDAPMSEEDFKIEFAFAGMDMTFGKGGLHGVGTASTDGMAIVDIDVASYYPALILKYGVGPKEWAGMFLPVYSFLRDRRLEAKKAGDKGKANAYKLLLNGTYGKFKSPNSVLYNKVGGLTVAVNGELWLLKLIEALAEVPGVGFIQANTDGVTAAVPVDRIGEFRSASSAWELDSGFGLEETLFSKIHMADVNNYVALGADGKVKTKGRFSATGFGKDGCRVPPVCAKAAA